MRELKFRQPKYDNDKFIGFHYWGFMNDCFVGIIPPIDIAKKESQQFTGLIDRLGKEIYEGDIIHYKEHRGYLLDSFVAEVKFLTDEAAFGFDKYGYDYKFCDTDELQSDLLDHISIIGNIFETPELLK